MAITPWRPGSTQPQRPHEDTCGCEQCEMVFHIVRYMLFYMPPTDRALRLPPEQD